MHIGVLTHNYPRFPGDFSGTFVEALSEEFVHQQQKVTVFAPYDPAYTRPLSTPNAPQLQLYRYAWPDRAHRLGYMRTMESDLALRMETYLLSPGLFAVGLPTLLRKLRRQSPELRPDVLHAHWVLPNGFMAAIASRLFKIPLVVSIPGSDALIANQNALFRNMARFAFQQAGLITANSVALRECVVPIGAERDKFDLILYGTNPNKLKPDSTGTEELRTQLGIPPETVILLCVGRMVPKKGFDFLLRAMADEALQEKNVVAVMVGDGDDKADWQQLAQTLGIAGRVCWVGSVPTDQIGVYYNMCDILMNPSVSRPADGLNVCVLDAMSCGKPIIGSNVAGNPLAIVEGKTGLIVPEQTVTPLAQAIARLVDDAELRQRMGRASRIRIEQELGWPHLARRYITHFERLIQQE